MQAKQIQFPCKFLRSKEMYYGEQSREDGLCGGGVFWCSRTQEGFGPDGQPVERAECCETRPCFSR
jgi:hypothetical protein